MGAGLAFTGLNSAASVAGQIPASPGVNQKIFGVAAGVTGLVGTGAALAVAAAGGTASAAASGGALLAATAAGPLAAILIPVMILLSRIFKGADPRQVPASQIEQAFEVAADNLYAVAKAGMVTKAQAASGMQVFLQKGVEYFGQMQSQLATAGNKGAANMGKVIRDEITAVLALPVVAPVPVDLAKAQVLYKANLPGGGAGWYPKSVAAGNNLADEFLKAMVTEGTSPAQVAAGPVAALGASVGSILSPENLAAVAKSPAKLLGLGVGAFAVVGLLRRFL